MQKVKTELGLNVEVTDLEAAVNEYDALFEELDDVKVRIVKQKSVVMRAMRKAKRNEIRCGDYIYRSLYVEKEDIRREKVAK